MVLWIFLLASPLLIILSRTLFLSHQKQYHNASLGIRVGYQFNSEVVLASRGQALGFWFLEHVVALMILVGTGSSTILLGIFIVCLATSSFKTLCILNSAFDYVVSIQSSMLTKENRRDINLEETCRGIAIWLTWGSSSVNSLEPVCVEEIDLDCRMEKLRWRKKSFFIELPQG